MTTRVEFCEAVINNRRLSSPYPIPVRVTQRKHVHPCCCRRIINTATGDRDCKYNIVIVQQSCYLFLSFHTAWGHVRLQSNPDLIKKFIFQVLTDKINRTLAWKSIWFFQVNVLSYILNIWLVYIYIYISRWLSEHIRERKGVQPPCHLVAVVGINGGINLNHE